MQLKGIAEHSGMSYTLKMLKRWQRTIETKKLYHENNLDAIVREFPRLLSDETYSPRIHNERLYHLNEFCDWLLVKGSLSENPIKFCLKKRKRQQTLPTRKPFNDSEIKLILEALKNDTYRAASSRYSHSQYYNFVYFLLATGVRNGEAIGLRVSDINFGDNQIQIWRSFSRGKNGLSNFSARVLKSTKNDKERFLPISPGSDLFELKKLCNHKDKNEFVFLNENKNPIDDRMFQRRVWNPLLQKLAISPRNLYACRHTFATRAVKSGMLAHEVAYLLGDSLTTVLRSYFHNNSVPAGLPKII